MPSVTSLSAWMMATALIVATVGAAELDDESVLLARLGNSQFVVRQEATETLLRDEGLTLDAIGDLYRRAPGEEQRQRLLAVARHHMLRQIAVTHFHDGKKGGIGITLTAAVTASDSSDLRQPGVRVTGVLAGFPGYAHLRTGDVILLLDRAPVADAKSFGAQVQRKRPGEPVNLTVLRDGKRVAVRFNLFHVGAMQKMYNPQFTRLRTPYSNAWRQTRLSLESGVPDRPLLVIDSPLPSRVPSRVISERRKPSRKARKTQNPPMTPEAGPKVETGDANDR